MKKLLLSVLAFMLSVAPAFATVEVQEDATREGNVSALNLGAGLDGSRSGGTYSITVEANPVLTTLVLEGATADAFETTLAAEDPTADNTVTLPNASGQVMVSTLATNTITAANSVYGASNALVFEGATADAFELSLTPADVGADLSVTLPTSTAAVATMYTALTTNSVDVANSITGASNSLIMEGATADGFETTISPVDPTADQTISVPNNAANSAFVTSSLTTNAVDAANAVTLTSNGFIAEGATADAFETTVSFSDPTVDQTLTVPATAGATGTFPLNGATVVITAGAAPTLTIPLAVNFIATDTIITDNQDQTITFSSGGTLGQTATIIFTTDAAGAADEVITFQTTLTNSTGTLTLANLVSNRYSVRFQSDGTVWNEVSRTGAQT